MSTETREAERERARGKLRAALQSQPDQPQKRLDRRLGYDLAKQARREGRRVRIRVSGVPGSVEGEVREVREGFVHIAGWGSAPWHSLDRFEILPPDPAPQPETGTSERTTSPPDSPASGTTEPKTDGHPEGQPDIQANSKSVQDLDEQPEGEWPVKFWRPRRRGMEHYWREGDPADALPEGIPVPSRLEVIELVPADQPQRSVLEEIAEEFCDIARHAKEASCAHRSHEEQDAAEYAMGRASASEAAARHLRQKAASLPADQDREDDRCDGCDDSGIYEEGDEWMPCTECERGRTFLAHLKTAVAEAREAAEAQVEELTREVKRQKDAGMGEFSRAEREGDRADKAEESRDRAREDVIAVEHEREEWEAKAQRYEAALRPDGAVTLAISDALGDELEGEQDWLNAEHEEFISNDPVVEALAERICEAARKALATFSETEEGRDGE